MTEQHDESMRDEVCDRERRFVRTGGIQGGVVKVQIGKFRMLILKCGKCGWSAVAHGPDGSCPARSSV